MPAGGGSWLGSESERGGFLVSLLDFGQLQSAIGSFNVETHETNPLREFITVKCLLLGSLCHSLWGHISCDGFV